MNASANVENVSPQISRLVMREMIEISKNAPEGIKVQYNEADFTDIQAVIEGPAGTPYAGGFFRVKLILGKDFPQTPPKAFFLTKIFHPNVAPNGEICVNTLKKDWKPDLGIKHILLTVKCLLIVPNAESALNEEAGKLLLEHYDDYSSRAKMMTEIHAQAERTSKALKMDSESIGDDGPQSKKHASDSRATNGQDKRKDKLGKDKKRVLKRL